MPPRESDCSNSRLWQNRGVLMAILDDQDADTLLAVGFSHWLGCTFSRVQPIRVAIPLEEHTFTVGVAGGVVRQEWFGDNRLELNRHRHLCR